MPTDELDARPNGGGPMTPVLAVVVTVPAPDLKSLAT
jgi:hypothetical protein